MDYNFSAETVIVKDCNLPTKKTITFNGETTKIGTITVSNSTMAYFIAESSTVGNITIDNCTFLSDGEAGAAIYVGNKTHIKDCTGLKRIQSKYCSDLTITNTICDDVDCGD